MPKYSCLCPLSIMDWPDFLHVTKKLSITFFFTSLSISASIGMQAIALSIAAVTNGVCRVPGDRGFSK